jgi:hypothetical protein
LRDFHAQKLKFGKMITAFAGPRLTAGNENRL